MKDLSSEFGPHLLDLAGARVLVYKAEDVDEAVRAVDEAFDIVDLLRGALKDPITPAQLDRLLPGAETLAAGASMIKGKGVDEPDDVSCVVGALWRLHGTEFAEIARAWPGRQGPVARLIVLLGQTRKNATRSKRLATARKSLKK